MSKYLRKIRKNRWYQDNPEHGWLREGELQAEVFGDLLTTDNKLSVWEVADDRSNLNSVIAALASTCDYVSNVDYTLLSAAVLIDKGFRVEPSHGDSKDGQANQNWHREIVQLSGESLLNLAHLFANEGTRERKTSQETATLLLDAVKSQRISVSDLKDDVSKKVLTHLLREGAKGLSREDRK